MPDLLGLEKFLAALDALAGIDPITRARKRKATIGLVEPHRPAVPVARQPSRPAATSFPMFAPRQREQPREREPLNYYDRISKSLDRFR
jgi:hypothetical protein